MGGGIESKKNKGFLVLDRIIGQVVRRLGKLLGYCAFINE